MNNTPVAGKVRIYKCPGCPGECCRPVGQTPPRPCDHCGADLTEAEVRVEIHGRYVADMMRRLRENMIDFREGWQ